MGRGCCWEKVPQNERMWWRMPGTGNTRAVCSVPTVPAHWRECSDPKQRQQQSLTHLGHATNSCSPLAVAHATGLGLFSHMAEGMAPWDIQVFVFFWEAPYHISCTYISLHTYPVLLTDLQHTGALTQEHPSSSREYLRGMCALRVRDDQVFGESTEMGKLLHGSNRHTQFPINRGVILSHSLLLYIIGDGCW